MKSNKSGVTVTYEFDKWFDVPNLNDNGVVKVIRCKDCIYWQDNNGGYPHEYCKWRGDETPDPDDYCSVAERKEE